MTRVFEMGLISVDPQKPVQEIIQVLCKHGITLKYVPQVFELTKAEIERTTPVYSPSALAREREAAQSALETHREQELKPLVNIIIEELAKNKVTVMEAERLFSNILILINAISVNDNKHDVTYC